MKLSRVLGVATSLLSASGALARASNSHPDLRPRTSNRYTDTVTWDPYSLSLLGQRIFIFAGEFHPFRLPVPSLWRDVLEKLKAGGLNTVSIYNLWSLTNPAEGVLDFDGFRDLNAFLELAKDVGVWVIVRAVSLYCNAEATGGGVPAWAATKNATLRSSDSEYTKAWTPYWTEIAKIVALHQISQGGPVVLVQIENEFDAGRGDYMAQLEQVFRENGIVVPTAHNNKGQRGYAYATGTGSVDIWGADSYPGGDVCSGHYKGQVVTNYNEYRNESGNPTIPVYMPEFKGGYFDPWGSTRNYSMCRAGTGIPFERVFYQALWAQAARLVSLYMYYGGTNWGGIAAPVVYSSYDYGAAIAENRVIGDKYNELKLQGLFLRSARDFREASFTPEVTTLTSTNIIVTSKLVNAKSGAGFWIVRHNDSTISDTTSFTLNITTSQGDFTIPQSGDGITLLGRDSRTIVTNYQFGKTHVIYSTPAVLLSATINDIDWFVVYGNTNADTVFEVLLDGTPEVTTKGDFTVNVTKIESTTLTTFAISPGGKALLSTGNTRILIFDESIATGFSAPVLPTSGTFGNFFEIGTNSTVLISGPNLVRSANLQGSKLTLVGDTDKETTIEVYGLDKGTKVVWNGKSVDTELSALDALTGTISGPTTAAREFKPPQLTKWRYSDALPEIKSGYDDSRWVLANKTSTFLVLPNYPRSGPELLAEQDYGFVVGNVLWRGHFNVSASGNESAVTLNMNGGPAFATSVWLNEVWIGSLTSWNSSDSDVQNGTFAFPDGALKEGENVVTVLKDNMGMNEASGTNGVKQARGIIGYGIVGGDGFTEWRVQGNFGGDIAYPDKTRGPLNEGGLYAERAGWHLPGFDDSKWEQRAPTKGIDTPGVGFFRTTFNLNVQEDHDVPMSFVINGGNATRVQLYINGWQMGKYVANLGPQHIFLCMKVFSTIKD